MYKLQNECYKNGCTVIIITWNSAATIERCIKSIPDAFPDEVPLEVLIVDKKGTDDTRKIIDRCFTDVHSKLNQIPYEILEYNGAKGGARYVGIQQAICKTILWLDSDIVLPKNYIEDLFNCVEWSTLAGRIARGSLNNIFGIQGHMYSGDTLAYKWWNGQDEMNFRDWGFCPGGPTSNLLVLNAFKLTEDERKMLCVLRSQEDTYLANLITKWGYRMYMFNVPTKHLIHDAVDKDSFINHKILLQLPGYKEMNLSRWKGIAKLKTIWRMKWIWARGINAYRYYHNIELLLMTLKLQLLIVRAFLKDKRLVSQEKLKELSDW